VSATVVNLGVSAEDDWKVRSKLSVSYGIRYETQNYLSNHHNFAPRLSVRYGVTPKTVLNAGFGIFYDRYQLTNLVTTLQSNGTNQIQTQIVGPLAGCTPQNIAACTAVIGSTGNKTVQASVNLRSPYTLHYAVGVDQQLFRGATLSLNYVIASGVHQFYTANLNSPTGFTADGQPIYPTPPKPPNQHPAIQDTYESGGVFHQQQLIINANIRPSRMWSVSGYGVFNTAKADTGTINTFPSINPYNIGQDYGRAVFDVRYRFFLFGNLSLPHAISVSPLMIFSAGTPYNITTGSDLNKDGQYNDRPRFGDPNGIPAGTPGTNTIAGCGSFVSPPPNTPYTPIPINYCTGPNQFTTNLRITKTFGFGESTRGAAQGQGQGGGQGGPGGPGGPGGRGVSGGVGGRRRPGGV